MAILIIGEKPSASKAIAQAILKQTTFTPTKVHPKIEGKGIDGKDYVITWCFGHLVALAHPEQYDPKYKTWKLEHLPILPSKMKLLPIPGKQAQLAYIKKLAKSSEFIVNGCDSGREGEAIFQFVLEYLQIQKPVKRLWTSSLTVEAIRTAFSEMKDGKEYTSLYQAARSRAEADWIIGLNGTRVFTCKHHDKFTVGRVQTPTLAILADRQHEIDHFVEEDFYEVEVLFKQVGQDFKGIWQGPRMKERSLAETIVQKVSGQMGAITSYEKKEEKNNPPKLYDLTLLQKEANAKFGFTADKTLKIAQKLYESKKISYPRTNSNYVDHTNIPFMHQVFELLKKTTYAPLAAKGDKKYVHVNNKHICRPEKIEDHHAILPTENMPRAFVSKDEEKLYDLIVKRFLAHFFPPAVYRIHMILVNVKEEPFKTTVKELLQSGWKVVYTEESDEDPLVENFSLDPNQPVTSQKGKILDKKTTPPKRFTEGTLVAAMQLAGREVEDEEAREAMKEHGIGTPATRAGMIEKLKATEYITTKGKYLYVTPKGMALIALIRKSGISLLASPTLTGQWEKRLNDITKGATVDGFMKNIHKFVMALIDQTKNMEALPKQTITKELANCPSCGGTIFKNSKAYSCSRWKEGCAFKIWLKINGKTLTEKNVQDLIQKGETRYLKFKNKNSGTYEAKFKLEDPKTGHVSLQFRPRKMVDVTSAIIEEKGDHE